MYKSFALAAIAALANARGDDSGMGNDNCFETVLVPTTEQGTLTVCTYNAWDDVEDTNEFHGDLYIDGYGITQATGVGNIPYAWVEFGFCLEDPNNATAWDCQLIKTDVGAARIDGDPTGNTGRAMSIFDGTMLKDDWNNSTGSQGSALNISALVTQDANTDASHKFNWETIPTKNSKTGCRSISPSKPDWTNCDQINAHWYRNWDTAQADDRVISDADADTNVRCWGWMQSMTSGDDGASPNWAYWGDWVDCKVAFSGYTAERDAAIAAEEAENNTDNTDDSGTDDNTTDDSTDTSTDTTDGGEEEQKDGAATIFSSAAALATAAFALSF